MLVNQTMISQIGNQNKRLEIKIEQGAITMELSDWYKKTGFADLRWSIFYESHTNIWEENLSSLEFSKKYMCTDWIDSLKEGEKEEVLKIIEGFLSRYSDTVVIFRYLSTLQLEKVAEKMIPIGKIFGFNEWLYEDIGLKFDKEFIVSDLIVSSEKFHEIISSAACYRSTIKGSPRREFVEALLCNLLKVYVKCVVDSFRRCFIPQLNKNGRIQRWIPRKLSEKSASNELSRHVHSDDNDRERFGNVPNISEKSEIAPTEVRNKLRERKRLFVEKEMSLPEEVLQPFSEDSATIAIEIKSEPLSDQEAMFEDTAEIPIKRIKTEDPEPLTDTFNTLGTQTNSCENNNDNEDQKTYRYLYLANDLCNLKYSIYSDDKSTDNIWKENWTRSSFAKRFMGNDWLSSLTEDEKNYVMRIIDTFLMVHSNVLPILDHYKTSKIKQLVGFLSETKVHPALKINSIRSLGLITKKRIDPSTQIVSMEKFRNFIESVPSSHFELRSGTRTPIRQLEFFYPFISKLLYIQVRCIIDGIRKLFTCRFEKRKIRFERKSDARGCCKNNEEQSTNKIKLDTSNSGSVDVGNVKEEIVEEEGEETEQNPVPGCI